MSVSSLVRGRSARVQRDSLAY